MSEKRYYYNTFYHYDDMDRVLEYEIIDRESYPNYPNHNESESIPKWYIYIGENDSGWQDMLVDKLNGQDKLIKELEREKEFWKGNACNCSNYLSILEMDCQIVQEAIWGLKNVIDVDTEAFKLLNELDCKFDELNQHRIRCMR